VDDASSEAHDPFVYAEDGLNGPVYRAIYPDRIEIVARESLGEIKFFRFVWGGSDSVPFMAVGGSPWYGSALVRCRECGLSLGHVRVACDSQHYKIVEGRGDEKPNVDRDKRLVGYVPTEREPPTWVRRESHEPDTHGPHRGARGWWREGLGVDARIRWRCICSSRAISISGLIQKVLTEDVDEWNETPWAVVVV
jgi:hypothetical protein